MYVKMHLIGARTHFTKKKDIWPHEREERKLDCADSNAYHWHIIRRQPQCHVAAQGFPLSRCSRDQCLARTTSRSPMYTVSFDSLYPNYNLRISFLAYPLRPRKRPWRSVRAYRPADRTRQLQRGFMSTRHRQLHSERIQTSLKVESMNER